MALNRFLKGLVSHGLVPLLHSQIIPKRTINVKLACKQQESPAHCLEVWVFSHFYFFSALFPSYDPACLYVFFCFFFLLAIW